jgi:hypothetical protein
MTGRTTAWGRRRRAQRGNGQASGFPFPLDGFQGRRFVTRTFFHAALMLGFDQLGKLPICYPAASPIALASNRKFIPPAFALPKNAHTIAPFYSVSTTDQAERVGKVIKFLADWRR